MTDFTLTFLGTGTSQGVPMISCDCKVCTSKDPRDRRSRSSIHLHGPDGAWVVDTGPDFREQCLREGIQRIDAALFSHAHSDHIMGFDDLRRFSDVLRAETGSAELPVYATPETMNAIRNAFHFAFDPPVRYPGYLHPGPRLIDGPFFLGETEVVPLQLPHGSMSVTGFLFKRNHRKLLAYFSDCKSIPPDVQNQIMDVEVLVVDALRHREHPTHMTVQEALTSARAARAQRTYLTHLCHELGHAELEATLPPNVRVAYDGLKLHLGQSTSGPQI